MSTYIVNVVIQIILARLLCPDDYAIVAMLAIFFAISQAFIDSGFPTALIQRKDCTQQDFSSVFYFNILIGITVYLLFYICAPLIADYYKLPELSKVTRVYSLILLIGSFSMMHRVILVKELRFKEIAYVTFMSSVLSAVPAIMMAYYGLGYWALVSQAILNSLFSCILLMYYSKWKPDWTLSKESLSRFVPFGLRVLLVYLFHAVYNNIYTMLIGKFFPSRELGYYDRGRTLSSMGPVGFSDFYTRALYPIQSKYQDDYALLLGSYNRSFALICLLIVPISVFMFFFSEEVVFTLFGSRWLQSGWILSILCIGYLFYPLQALNMNILKVKGRADYLLKSEAIKKIIGIIIVLVAVQFELKFVVYSWTVSALLEFVISQYFCYRLCRFPLKESVKSIACTVSIATFIAWGIHTILELFFKDLYSLFFAGGCLYIMAYVAVTYRKVLVLIKK